MRFRLAAVVVAMLLGGCAVRSETQLSAGTDAVPTPERVAIPGVPDGTVMNFPAIDPVDGSLWFSIYRGEDFNRQTLVRAPYQEGWWGIPVPVILTRDDRWGARAPRFSPDGQRLYFTSNRPRSASDTVPNWNIWSAERRGTWWGDLVSLPAPVNTDATEIHAAATAAGDLFVPSRRGGSLGLTDIWLVRRRGDGWDVPLHLPAPINDERSQPDLWVAPDGSWMVLVVTDHPQGLGGDDLFISRFVNGAWSTPVHLPAPINGPGYEYGPSVSPDGRMLYFNSERDGGVAIYRVPVSALSRYR
ncbi:MAG TPA: hypothetical protein VFQ45_04595 [Longimicrobium sp.]|nr:hypothetical protein [Longimicrobium sp.]